MKDIRDSSSEMSKILLLSESPIKKRAVEEFFPDMSVTTLDCSALNLPSHPFVTKQEDGFHLTMRRMSLATSNENAYDYIIAIENVLYLANDETYDICYVSIMKDGCVHGMSFSIPVEKSINDELWKSPVIYYSSKESVIRGIQKGVGEIAHERDASIDPKNWMAKLNKIDRVEQITDALHKAMVSRGLREVQKNLLNSTYEKYENWPNDGVLFQDVFPLFENPAVLKEMVQLVANHYRYHGITHVVGLESRGFCLGVPVAYELGVGFLPVRKAGKLPGQTIRQSYGKEYGKDVCEMQRPNERKNYRVLILDDLIATGGSMRAAVDLVTQLGYEIVDCCVLKEVPELRENCQKTMQRPYTVLLK